MCMQAAHPWLQTKFTSDAHTKRLSKARAIGLAFLGDHTMLAKHRFRIQHFAVHQARGMTGLQGVQENAFFFKSIADAHALRQRVCECFERAALPTITEQVHLAAHLNYDQHMTSLRLPCVYWHSVSASASCLRHGKGHYRLWQQVQRQHKTHVIYMTFGRWSCTDPCQSVPCCRRGRDYYPLWWWAVAQQE